MTEKQSSSFATRREQKKLITLRLQKGLLADLKNLAKLRGVRYQTLINDVLFQWTKEGKVDP